MRVQLVLVPPGGGETDYTIDFDLPGVPQPGDYISVSRPREVGTSDFIVRRSWWVLDYPFEGGFRIGEVGKELPPGPMGSLKHLVVECEFAIGSFSSETHKRSCEMYQNRGKPLREFEATGY